MDLLFYMKGEYMYSVYISSKTESVHWTQGCLLIHQKLAHDNGNHAKILFYCFNIIRLTEITRQIQASLAC